MESAITFAEKLDNLLVHLDKEQGISLSDFCKDTGVNKRNLKRYLKGEDYVILDDLIIIANYFEVSCDFLLGHKVARKVISTEVNTSGIKRAISEVKKRKAQTLKLSSDKL